MTPGEKTMNKGKQIYEGKAKILYDTEDPDLLICYFKDDATAFNALKKGTIVDKGVINCAVSSKIFRELEATGIQTHFVEQLSEREMLVKRVQIIPLEVVVRNRAAGSLVKRLGRKEGEILPEPLVEWYYKSDALGDPLLTENHVKVFRFASASDLNTLETYALQVNRFLVPYFDARGIILVDYKLEFGRAGDAILLADEITPDGCRLWDKETKEKLDKDRFRFDLGKVEEGYQTVYQRVCE